MKADPKKLGPEINSLMLYVHNRTAEEIVSAIQVEILNPNPFNGVDLTPEHAYLQALNKAKDIAKAQIKDSATLK